MELSKQVCSLELSKRLKELSVKQDAYFWWYDTLDNDTVLGHHLEYANPLYAAFTVAELGERLPASLENKRGLGLLHNYIIDTFKDGKTGEWHFTYTSAYSQKVHEGFIADTEAEARGLMLAYLLENKLLDL